VCDIILMDELWIISKDSEKRRWMKHIDKYINRLLLTSRKSS
jgi:hypothetical protein